MTQVETIRPADFGVPAPEVILSVTQAEKTRLAELLRDGQGRATLENTGLDAESEMIRDQFRKFADAEVVILMHPHDTEYVYQGPPATQVGEFTTLTIPRLPSGLSAICSGPLPTVISSMMLRPGISMTEMLSPRASVVP